MVGANWLDISNAAKDGTVVWAAFRTDIYPALRPNRPDLEIWNGLQIALRHPGLARDGFDVGWQIAAPVGHGGIPDEWIAGYLPLPEHPEHAAKR